MVVISCIIALATGFLAGAIATFIALERLISTTRAAVEEAKSHQADLDRRIQAIIDQCDSVLGTAEDDAQAPLARELRADRPDPLPPPPTRGVPPVSALETEGWSLKIFLPFTNPTTPPILPSPAFGPPTAKRGANAERFKCACPNCRERGGG